MPDINELMQGVSGKPSYFRWLGLIVTAAIIPLMYMYPEHTTSYCCLLGGIFGGKAVQRKFEGESK